LWIVVLVVDGTFCTIPTIGILRGGSFLFRRNLIAVKLFKEFPPNSLVLKIPTKIPTDQYQYGINTDTTGQAASIKTIQLYLPHCSPAPVRIVSRDPFSVF
jgi:hypothetical protein